MEYRKRFEVRFGEVDLAGVFHYPRLYSVFHVTMEDFWREALGRHYADVLGEERVGYPTVRVETDFRASLRFGDAFDIVLTVPEVGERSVTWRYRGFREGETSPFVEARIKTACVEMDTWRPRPVPPEHRALLEPYGEG